MELEVPRRMRGDSIRDLYAKTLALLGLGVLAATGALVDYWPSGVRLPVIESRFAQRVPSLALAVPEDAFQTNPPILPDRPRLRRRVIDAPAINLATFVPEMSPPAFGDASDDVTLAVAATRPAALVPVTFAPQDVVASLGEEVSLSEPPATWIESTLVMSPAPVALSAADDGGMLSGMVRATKSSLVLTGRKTGASIVGAFRAVSGAVKKAIPN
jgi:hypothetical protein